MATFSFGRFAAPAPTPYHLSAAHLLERRWPELWTRFESREARAEAAEEMGLELARRAEPIDLRSAPELYEAAGEISRAMGLEAPTTLYRAAPPLGLKRNAALYFEPDHAHVVFEGDLLETLTGPAMWYVLGHELAHHRLWTAEDGRLWTAHRLLRYAAAARGAPEVHKETFRLEKLYTEVFADRFGLWACGDLEAALTAHVRIATGQEDASGAAYLAMAEAHMAERAAADAPAETPPAEGYVRAVLLAAWARDAGAAEARARTLVEGEPPLERLDLLGQERLADITHWMLYEFLDGPWGRRPLVHGHAAQISDTLAEALSRPRAKAGAEDADLDRLRRAIANAHPGVRRYLAYLLLDFSTVDPQIEDAMLAAALQFAGDFSLGGAFRAVAAQELKITKSKLADLEKNASEILRRAEILWGDPEVAEAAPLAPPIDPARLDAPLAERSLEEAPDAGPQRLTPRRAEAAR